MAQLLREAIGGTIRRARTERARTLRDVSRDARVSLGYLSEIERGRKEPSSELLAAICDALALPLPELLDDVADALRPQPATARLTVPSLVGVDPALRSAVEEALSGEPTPEQPAATEAAPEPVTDGQVADVTEQTQVVDQIDEPEPRGDPEVTAVPDDEGPEPVDAAGELRLVELVTLGRPGLVRSAAA